MGVYFSSKFGCGVCNNVDIPLKGRYFKKGFRYVKQYFKVLLLVNGISSKHHAAEYYCANAELDRGSCHGGAYTL